MLEQGLRDLDRELSRRLPETEAQARLAEAESHLREGVEARIALGLGRVEAEAEALAAFGDLRRHARMCRDRHDFGPERWRWLVAMNLVFATPPHLVHTRFYFLPLLAFVAAWAGFARASIRARRPARISVAIALTVAIAVPIFYVFGLSHEGFGNASRMVLVDGPRSVLPPFGKAAIDVAYEFRFLLAVILGVPAGTDLLFASLSCCSGIRRRCRRA